MKKIKPPLACTFSQSCLQYYIIKTSKLNRGMFEAQGQENHNKFGNGIDWSQHVEHMQVPNGIGPGVQRKSRLILIALMEYNKSLHVVDRRKHFRCLCCFSWLNIFVVVVIVIVEFIILTITKLMTLRNGISLYTCILE